MIQAFSNLITLSKNFTDEDVCRKYLEEIIWNGKTVCRIVMLKRFTLWTMASVTNVLTKNVCPSSMWMPFLRGSKLPLCKWFHAIYVITSHKKGIGSHQLAKDIGITQKSAWFVLSRIREILKEQAPYIVDWILEVDECYIGGRTLISTKARLRESKR